ncbi:MAG: hypothetical protein INR71_01525, partial [Terriglobus roseus]|nr:hypothetical protein [Terriglobus roseus]
MTGISFKKSPSAPPTFASLQRGGQLANPRALKMSQQQAQNIITYVGVPLAVLGVLPTLSTTLQSLLTQRAVRRTLRDNGVTALTRSSLLSGIVEVEMPRLSLQPLDRADPAYWKLRPARSQLRGGSWSIFFWNEMAIGSKSYRLQYHDELAQPQAEVGFEELVAFLLDRGAVPCKQGLADLRSSGLWTPAGTKLLLSPCTAHAVLAVARSDDSDGILSLSMAWESEWDRGHDDRLPPYWVRIRPSRAGKQEQSNADDKKNDAQQQVEELAENGDDPVDEKPTEEDADSASDLPSPSPIRIRIGPSGVEQAHREHHPSLPFPLTHLRNPAPHAAPSPAALWFATACTALAAPTGTLWSFSPPAALSALAHRDALVPCGVLVRLGLLADAAAPA